ncbi:TPA: SPFH domain-containing protein, partial [Enterococcus faecium]
MREKRAFYINGYAGIVGLVVLALVGLFFLPVVLVNFN